MQPKVGGFQQVASVTDTLVAVNTPGVAGLFLTPNGDFIAYVAAGAQQFDRQRSQVLTSRWPGIIHKSHQPAAQVLKLRCWCQRGGLE
jgi:hypothetical protein